MSRISYIDGRYVDHADAYTHIEDRGYQFADGMYEYIAFYNRRLLDGEAHLARLSRSLSMLSIPQPMSLAALKIVIAELIERNGRDDGGLYMQVTRGVARRDHPFPKDTRPVLSMTICAAKLPKPKEIENGVFVIVQPDIRWGRCDIKTIALLANVLAKQEAASANAREAWLVREDGVVTEGAVSNSYIVSNGTLITHPENNRILPGVTRTVVLKLAREVGIPVEERPFTLAEANAAQEAFLTSTSVGVLPVTRIAEQVVGNGKPGEITKRLMNIMAEHIYAQTGKIW